MLFNSDLQLNQKQLDNFADSAMLSLVSPDGKLGRMSGRIVDPGSYTMLQKNEVLADFMASEINGDLLDYRLTGTPVVVDKSSRYLSENVIVGLLFAFLIMCHECFFVSETTMTLFYFKS